MGLCAVFLLPNSCMGGDDAVDGIHHQGDEVHSRQKRFVYFNTQSPVDIGMVNMIKH